MREEYYYYWLGRIRGIGLRTIEEWIKEGYTPEQFYRGDSVFLRSIRGMTEKMKEQILDPVWKEQTKKEWELCQKEEIRYYMLHQANSRIVSSVAKHMKEPLEKFPMNIENLGNTSSASIPILLDEWKKKERLKAGDWIILSGFGGGLTYGASLLKWLI